MSSKNQIDMTQGSILGKLLKFTLPLIFSSILQLLFNAADIVVVGRFAGDDCLAAVGSTSSLIHLLVNLFQGLSIGTNVVAAHYFGAGDKQNLKETVHTSMLVSIYSGIILTVIGVVFAKPLLLLMQSPENVLNLAVVYLRIYFGGIISAMIYNFGSALLRAKGDTQRPLYILLASGVLNVILNLIFVICFKMDVAGVAWATIISQIVSAIMVVYLLLKEPDDFHLSIKDLKLNTYIFSRMFKIGIPAGFQGIMFSLSNVIIQSSVNSFGEVMIAANSAVSNLEGFVYTSMNGFSQGALTFCSQNMGAKKLKRVNKVVWVSQLCVIVIGGVLSSIFILLRRPLIGIYTKSPEVIESGMVRVFVIFSTYYLCGMMDCMANSIRGIGHSLLPAIITIFGVCVLRITWLSTVFMIPKYHLPITVYLSYPISWIITFSILTVSYFVIYRKLKKQLQ